MKKFWKNRQTYLFEYDTPDKNSTDDKWSFLTSWSFIFRLIIIMSLYTFLLICGYNAIFAFIISMIVNIVLSVGEMIYNNRSR